MIDDALDLDPLTRISRCKSISRPVDWPTTLPEPGCFPWYSGQGRTPQLGVLFTGVFGSSLSLTLSLSLGERIVEISRAPLVQLQDYWWPTPGLFCKCIIASPPSTFCIFLFHKRVLVGLTGQLFEFYTLQFCQKRPKEPIDRTKSKALFSAMLSSDAVLHGARSVDYHASRFASPMQTHHS